jgi:hypothetical protein
MFYSKGTPRVPGHKVEIWHYFSLEVCTRFARVLVSGWVSEWVSDRETEIKTSCSQNYHETDKSKDTTSPYFEAIFVGNQSPSTFSFTVRIIEQNLRQYFKTFHSFFCKCQKQNNKDGSGEWPTQTTFCFELAAMMEVVKSIFMAKERGSLPSLMQIHRTTQDKVK